HAEIAQRSSAIAGRRLSKLILIVDDSAEVGEMFAAILVAEGYDVMLAADGREALALAAKRRADVVLLALMMPELHGVGFLERLPHEVAPPLPIVVAASGFDRFRRLALERGAHAFISKPIDAGELVAIVASALSGAAMDEALLRAHDRRIQEGRADASR